MDRGTWQATVHGVTESDMTEQLSLYCMTHIHKVQWLVVIVLSTYNVTCSVLSAFSLLFPQYATSLSLCVLTCIRYIDIQLALDLQLAELFSCSVVSDSL